MPLPITNPFQKAGGGRRGKPPVIDPANRPPSPGPGYRWSANQQRWVLPKPKPGPTTPPPDGGTTAPEPTTPQPSPFNPARPGGNIDLGYTMPPPPQGAGNWSNSAGGIQAPGDYNDPYNAYLAAVPVMTNMMNQKIGDAMEGAGFSGNRYSSGAMETAGKIGADTSMALNQMLNQTMYDQSNKDLDRALASAGQQINLGGAQDQATRDRLNSLFGYGSWEQGRQDNQAQGQYQQWWQQMTWPLQMLIQAASSQGAGNPGTPYQMVTNPGTQPTIPPELIPIIARVFGL